MHFGLVGIPNVRQVSRLRCHCVGVYENTGGGRGGRGLVRNVTFGLCWLVTTPFHLLLSTSSSPPPPLTHSQEEGNRKEIEGRK